MLSRGSQSDMMTVDHHLCDVTQQHASGSHAITADASERQWDRTSMEVTSPQLPGQSNMMAVDLHPYEVTQQHASSSYVGVVDTSNASKWELDIGFMNDTSTMNH
jgi:hypothetical protein